MTTAKIDEVKGYITDGLYPQAQDELDNLKTQVSEISNQLEGLKLKLADQNVSEELIDYLTAIQIDLTT